VSWAVTGQDDDSSQQWVEIGRKGGRVTVAVGNYSLRKGAVRITVTAAREVRRALSRAIRELTLPKEQQ
jgi:hypothetical protein